MNFTEKDIEQLKAKGISLEEVELQIQTFKQGISCVNLTSAATIGNGILQIPDQEKRELVKFFEDSQERLSIVKFVPASGAATRMFKFLFEFLESKKADDHDIITFFENLERQPFYENVMNKIRLQIANYDQLEKLGQQLAFVNMMLDEDKMNMGNEPKGLLPFHKYDDYIATAFEEHLYEAAEYSQSNKQANLYFTVSRHHITKFKEKFQEVESAIENETSTQFNIEYSTQKESTDTIAVNLDNSPIRDEEGHLLFRPSGHGALINNLNSITADIVFIKNIDNVVVRSKSGNSFENKKLLAGKLIELQQKSFLYLELLDSSELTREQLHEIATFVECNLNSPLETQFESLLVEEKMMSLKQKLDRPIRICGMVKNEGEPGGGPFAIRNSKGEISYQIVESAQIDKDDETQTKILQEATHFNPVDLVCSIKNYKGKKFNLMNYIDENTGFISEKTRLGKPLKALERPGLWNGSMANWITIFVEVPLSTFNPVKTINDLLKPAHQTN